jgi:hypothetical protein
MDPWSTPQTVAAPPEPAARKWLGSFVRRGAYLGCMSALILSALYAFVVGCFTTGSDFAIEGLAFFFFNAFLVGGLPSVLIGTIAGAVIGALHGGHAKTPFQGGTIGALVSAVLLIPIVLYTVGAAGIDSAFSLIFGLPALIAWLALTWVGARLSHDQPHKS